MADLPELVDRISVSERVTESSESTSGEQSVISKGNPRLAHERTEVGAGEIATDQDAHNEAHENNEADDEDDATEDEDDEHGDDDDDDEYKTLAVQFGPLLAELKDRIDEARAYHPKIQDEMNPTARESFQVYWQNVLKDVELLAASNGGMPEHLTRPVTKSFRVWVFKKDSSADECPCCLPQCGDDIVLENEQGVTKQDFIRGISQYLYGDVTKYPKLHNIDTGSTEPHPVVTVDFDYMLTSSPDGDNEKYLIQSREPGIWMFCTTL